MYVQKETGTDAGLTYLRSWGLFPEAGRILVGYKEVREVCDWIYSLRLLRSSIPGQKTSSFSLQEAGKPGSFRIAVMTWVRLLPGCEQTSDVSSPTTTARRARRKVPIAFFPPTESLSAATTFSDASVLRCLMIR